MEIVAAHKGFITVKIGTAFMRLSDRYIPLITAVDLADNSPQEYYSHLRSAHPDIPTVEARRFLEQTYPQMVEAAAKQRPSYIKFQLNLLSPSIVQGISKYLRFCFSWWFVALIAFAAILAFVKMADQTPASAGVPGNFPISILLIFIGILIHEFGHTAALSKFGKNPGRIGVGLYFVFPAFFADVTETWTLSPKQRVIVDAGGIWLQSAYSIILNTTNFAFLGMDLLFFNVVTVGLLLRTLNPIFKFDGYWIISDLFNIPNLHKSVVLCFKNREWKGSIGKIIFLYAVALVSFYVYLFSTMTITVLRLSDNLKEADWDISLSNSLVLAQLVIIIVFLLWITTSSVNKIRSIFGGQNA